MKEYRIIIRMRDVAEGDATSLAQKIWDEEAEGMDTGDFDISVAEYSAGTQFDTGWEPDMAEGA